MKDCREKRCTGKARHMYRKAAEKHKALIFEKTGLKTRVYRCPYCKNFHIGEPDYRKDPAAFWSNVFVLTTEAELQNLGKEIKGGE